MVGQIQLPVPQPCLSFWQYTTRSFPYLNANQTEAVPASSPYVVIGSGISGALTAFELIEQGIPATDIVILEAREAASGASSRNAGHVRPDAFRGFQVYKRLHGTEQALKIIANERLVFQRLDDFVKQHKIECDFNPTTTFDVCLTQEFADFNAQSLKEFQAAGGDVSHIKFYDGDEARRRTGVMNAVAAYEWPAGSSHPAKLAHFLLAQAIEKGGRLFTHCPAQALSKSASSTPEQTLWDIGTPRGTITATTVVHCTNAFAPHLLPRLSRLITPTRAQAHAFFPPPALNGPNKLASTMSLRHGLKHFYSMTQRRPDGVLILGAPLNSPTISQAASESRLVPDDRIIHPEVREDALTNFEACFPACRRDVLGEGEGLRQSWTGILGMTPDSVPFVGRVSDMPGNWVCAGFNGHGKPRTLGPSPGIVADTHM